MRFLFPVLTSIALVLPGSLAAAEKYQSRFYTVHPIDTVHPTGTVAKWFVFEPARGGNKGLVYPTAQELLQHFDTKPIGIRTNGIWIYSKSFALADAKRDLLPYPGANPYLWNRYNDKQWRDSENALVGDLVRLCRKQKIPLRVNTRVIMISPWKLL